MKFNSARLKNVMFSLVLLIASLIVSLFVIETSLRLFYPKYEYAAESDFDRNTTRLVSRRPYSHQIFKHPDTGNSHSVYYNSLALRQHREFDRQAIKSSINVAFFGDSFTENLRLPSQYSFTEPLDYLLNVSGASFNVFNLGVDSYGTDQAYLYYRDFEYSQEAEYVFYIFCVNDIRNIFENNLFSMSEFGELIQNEAYISPWWIRFLSKLHSTYLMIDIRQVLLSKSRNVNKRAIEDFFAKKNRKKHFHSKRADGIQQAFIAGQETDDLKKSLAIFKLLLHSWKESVEMNGGKFYVVLLPRYEEHSAKDLLSEYNVINLYEKFDNDIDNYDYSNFRFKNEGHWNEAANQLTAVYLYRLLEKEADLFPLSKNIIREQLYTYYSSFKGWMPDDIWLKKVVVPSEKSEIIKSKYTELDIENSGS